MDDAKKWQDLDAKLSNGMSLRAACLAAGIDLKSAIIWVNQLREIEESEQDAERIAIDGIRSAGITNLIDLSYYGTEEENRVKAAIALLTHYREERKRLERQTKKESTDTPLFGPWDIKRPGV